MKPYEEIFDDDGITYQYYKSQVIYKKYFAIQHV
jgi:hypothetical protein